MKFRVWDKKLQRMCPMEGHDYKKDPWDANSSVYLSSDGRVYRDYGDRSDEPHLGDVTGDVVVLLDTGLKDTKGREVYEGDVLRVGEHYDGDNMHREYLGVVTFIVGECWRVREIGAKDDGDSLFDAAINHHAEIVGNIYENESLLEE